MADEGTAYVYETSVLHKGVYGCKGHVTAEVLLLAHIAKPDPNDNSRSILSVISQIDPKTASMPGAGRCFLGSGSRCCC